MTPEIHFESVFLKNYTKSEQFAIINGPAGEADGRKPDVKIYKVPCLVKELSLQTQLYS
jgi:hypothetical protein